MADTHHQRRILIVDDEPQILTSLEDLLEEDFVVITTTDPSEALRKLKSEEIAVILSDQRMPKILGDHFLDQARRISEATRVLITGYSDINALVRAVNNGQIYAYVSKPWDPLALKITVRKAADHYDLVRDLSHEKELLHILMDNIPDSIYYKDRNCQFTRINKAKASVLGIERPEEAIGKTDHDFFPDEQVVDSLVDEQRILETGEPLIDRILKLTKADRTIRWLSTSKVPIRDRDGQIIGLVGINRDVTERKRAEALLQASEDRLQTLVDNHPDGVCLLDGEFRLILTNAKCLEYLRLLGDYNIGNPITGIGNLPIEKILLPRSDGLPHEIILTGKEDQIFELDTRLIEGTATKGWVLALREVTIERQTRERIQRQYHLVSIGQMAAGIAHDFNNMLTVMMGTAQILEMQKETPDDTKESLRIIFEQGQRASQLVRQILDFARKTDVERQAFNLVPFMKEAVKLMQKTLPEIQIEITMEITTCNVQANLTQLQQIVTNLAINARDAMPKGGKLNFGLTTICLAAGDPLPFSLLEIGEWAVWTISDTGTGIPPEVIKHIYEPFFTTKETGKGTGLGLAQVYGIVRQHEGFIDVESEIGRGTTFTIYLPLIADQENQTKDILSVLPKGHGETILLVEDQAEVLKMAQSMLENLNYKVLSAKSKEEALFVFEAHHNEIVLVLIDWVISKWRGPELLQEFKNKNPRLLIVNMSGYPIENPENGITHSEIDGWLEKPLSFSKVAQTIITVLRKRS